MMYLGGKSRIASALCKEIAPIRRGKEVWDAFCGGLAMSHSLSKTGPVVASDVNGRLIGVYAAVRSGWRPPIEVSGVPEEGILADYCYFFLGFGGIPGAKLVPAYREHVVASGPEKGRIKRMWSHRATAEKTLQYAVEPRAVFQADFLSVRPRPTGAVLYLDPPYRGTLGYDAPFDSDVFFERAEAWAKFGPVFVSEYACPIGRLIWEKPMKTGQFARGRQTEKLFLVGG